MPPPTEHPLPDSPLQLPVRTRRRKTIVLLAPFHDAVRAHEDDDKPLVVAVDGPRVNPLTLAAALFSKLLDWHRPQLDLYIARPSNVGSTPPGDESGHTALGERREVHDIDGGGHESMKDDSDNGNSDNGGGNVDDDDDDDDASVVVGPDGPPDPFLVHGVVAVGGTFDRLHAGHRLLLCATAWAARDGVRVGVTGAELLRGKTHASLIGSVEHRASRATQYVRRARAAAHLPAVGVLHTVLRDRSGPAATEPVLDALVVSHETLPGAPVINEHRRGLGLDALALVVVPVLEGRSGKLGSSALRGAEAGAGARIAIAGEEQVRDTR